MKKNESNKVLEMIYNILINETSKIHYLKSSKYSNGKEFNFFQRNGNKTNHFVFLYNLVKKWESRIAQRFIFVVTFYVY